MKLYPHVLLGKIRVRGAHKPAVCSFRRDVLAKPKLSENTIGVERFLRASTQFGIIMIAVNVMVTLPTNSYAASTQKNCALVLAAQSESRPSETELILSDLSHLRIAIDDAHSSKLASLARGLSAAYQAKLREAEVLHLSLAGLASEIEKLRKNTSESRSADKERRRMVREQERDLQDWVPFQTMQATRSVEKAVMNSDGSLLVTGGRYGELLVWDFQRSANGIPLIGHNEEIRNIKFTADNHKLLSVSSDAVTVWDVNQARQIRSIRSNGRSFYGADMNFDGTRLATLSGTGGAEIWDPQHDQPVYKLSFAFGPIRKIAFSSDGNQILLIGEKNVSIHDSQNGNLLSSLQRAADDVSLIYDAKFSHDATRILITFLDGSASLWNTSNGKLRQNLVQHSKVLRFANYSPDSSKVLIGSDNDVTLFDSQTGQQVAVLPIHGALLKSAVFNPSGNELILSVGDFTALAWRIDGANPIQVLKRQTDSINAVVFKPDGKSFFTVSSDKSIVRWTKPATKDEE